jgi:transcriptional regulator with XRE-family HTH domain
VSKSTPIAKQLQQAIKQAERAGVSRYAIAKAAGVALPVLIRVANGGTIPRLDTADKIARAIGKKLTINN